MSLTLDRKDDPATPAPTTPPEEPPRSWGQGASDGERKGRRRGPRRPLPATMGLYVLITATFALFAIPLYWLFSSALKPEHEIYTYPLTWVPTELEWSNFADAWTSAPFGAFLKNSIITTVVGTGLEIGVALLSAYAFAFVYFRGKMLVFALMVGSLMLPGHITLLVNYITISNLGWLNTYQGLILPGIGSAFAMFLVYQQMRQVPEELVDAAKMDGAGHLRRLSTVVIPICRPMILTATLIVLITKWNDFVWPLIVTSTSDMRTLPIGLMFLRSQEGYDAWGPVMAGTVIVAAPMLIVFFIAQRRIIGGITAGAIKG
ncbi:carbohydrate ABC transporter permease [Ruania alba]|uniref:Carbohydrate ABC transporter membrane protein 2, CUT1 family n=1 Tax=Ruania alba TaxID=648782 RepID=A0A1H5G9D3_9MICO|nr:carbohydrate ABC transporter permease [Ruania alba]SEE11718.1 carbohydrate ABC transporter membrane protein 2, CUT1 family [Ruania alba]